MNRYLKNIIIVSVIILLALLIRTSKGPFGQIGETKEKVTYSQAWKLIEDDKVVSGTLRKNIFIGELKKDGKKIQVTLDPADPESSSEFKKHLLANNVEFSIDTPMFSDMAQGVLLSIILPFGLIAVLWVFLMR